MKISLQIKFLIGCLFLVLLTAGSISAAYYILTKQDKQHESRQRIQIAFEVILDDIAEQFQDYRQKFDDFLQRHETIYYLSMNISERELKAGRHHLVSQLAELEYMTSADRLGIYGTREHFEITAQTLKNLRNEGISDEIVDNLISLENQEFLEERKFVKAVEHHIGKENTMKYQEHILKYARGGKRVLMAAYQRPDDQETEKTGEVPETTREDRRSPSDILSPAGMPLVFEGNIPEITSVEFFYEGQKLGIRVMAPISRDKNIVGALVGDMFFTQSLVDHYGKLSKTAINLFAGNQFSLGTLPGQTVIEPEALEQSVACEDLFTGVQEMSISPVIFDGQDYYQGRCAFRNSQGTMGAITVSLSQEGEKQEIREILMTVLAISGVVSVIALGLTLAFSQRAMRFIRDLATSIDQLSKGNIPNKITDEYQGEFNDIKQNLNLLIEAMDEATRLAEEISAGNLQIRVKERSEHDQLMKALNRMVQRLNAILQETHSLIAAVQTGKLETRGNVEAFAGVWQELVIGTNSLIDAFVIPINRMAQSFERIGQGDIAETITEEFGGLNRIKHDLILMMQRLHEIVMTVRRAADNVAANSEEMSASSEQMSQSTSHQAAAAEEVSASIAEMAANIAQNANNALKAQKIALQSAEETRKSGEAVAETVVAMQQIAQKITIIAEIAEQTRMLSLNATIEAARAQEHGKAFSVVASEVRVLSNITKMAAEEINELTSSSLNVAEKAGAMLEKLVPNIEATTELIQEISAASSEQSVGAAHINTAIQQLDAAIQQNAQTAGALAAMAEQLASQAEQFRFTIDMFKVPDYGPEAVYDYAAEHHGKERARHGRFSPETFARQTYKIGFTFEGVSHPHLVALKNDVEAIAAQYPNIELELVSAEDDIVKQTLDLNKLLQKGVDVLLVQSTNPQMLFPGLKRAEQMGIPYFFCLRGALGVNSVAQVIASYSYEGKVMGEFIAREFEDGGNVVIIEGILGDASSIARCMRFRKELEKNPQFKILASRSGQYRREPSRELMEEFLREFPRIDIVYGANDEAALGAAKAVRAAGRLNEITVVGVDGEREALEAIQAGEMFATVTHGRLRDMTTAGVAMHLIIDYLNGKEIPRWLVSDARLVTKENVVQITPLF